MKQVRHDIKINNEMDIHLNEKVDRNVIMDIRKSYNGDNNDVLIMGVMVLVNIKRDLTKL